MPGSTPIYGFPYPDPSDLVANYPALGQQLAEDIEDVLPTLGGLTKVTVQSFTSVATVNVNTCFSTTYAKYRVMLNVTHASATGANMRLRSATTDDSSANYDSGGYYGGSNQGNGISLGGTSWPLNVGNLVNRLILMDIVDPFIAVPTKMNGSLYETSDAGTNNWYSFGMGHRSSTAYDGCTFYFGQNGTGTVSVYGYQN